MPKHTRQSLTRALLIGVGLTLSACSDLHDATGPTLDAPIQQAILDGERGGDPHFFWLPPTVATGPSVTGFFDAGALDALAVEVCKLDDAGACTTPLVETFTATGQSAIARIRLDAAKEQYSVIWQTGRSHVDDDSFYRVTVRRNGSALGFLDVDPVKNTPALAGVDPARYVGVVAGQQLELRFRIDIPSARTSVRINEIESNGGVPGDWVELISSAGIQIDLSGYVIKDNDDGHVGTLPAGSVIPANGFLMVEESTLGFGLGSGDAVRFYQPDGTTLIDSYVWTAHAPSTFGRCPDLTGAFRVTTTVTKSAPNDCSVIVKINEIESNGGVPGDWAELFNPSPAPADLSGFVFKDGDDTHVYTIPAGTTIAAGGYFLLEEAAFGFGLGAADAARLFTPEGTIRDQYSWTAHVSTTYGRCPNGTGAFTTTGAASKGAANVCVSAAAFVKINEIESNGGVPGDWVELINTGSVAADVSGLVFKDNDDTHAYAIPAGTVIVPGGFSVLDEASFGFGLGAADAARLYQADGATLLDSHTWTVHATTTYGRCPDGTGAFATTTTSTKGAANACGGSGGGGAQAWPGDALVVAADPANVLGGNMSGLTYEGAVGVMPPVLWAVKNGPGTMYRLVWNGTNWAPDAADGWGAGKTLRYPDGTGNPDAEGVTFASGGSAAGMYVSTERNNDVSAVSRNAILRFDLAGAGATLSATQMWDITADLPVVGSNLGIEAITWIPDSFLTARGFFDERLGAVYNPAAYPNHGTGLFFVGVEANGGVYAYALDHVTGTHARVATITSGFVGVMALEFDRELNNFWVVCDDGCAGRSAILQINAAGRFVPTRVFERPASMANLNNEGFAVATQAECVADRKPVFWSDDSNTGGNAIRMGKVQCSAFAPAPVVVTQ